MRKVIFISPLLFLFFLPDCIKAQKLVPHKKILIVYLSRTSNTKAIAEIIHQNVGGTLTALELENPYPKDYKTTVDQVSNELKTGFLPSLKTKIVDMDQYDVIFVGFPTWAMQLPPPMQSFLKQYDFSGKTIIPFNTNAGYGAGNSFETVKKLCSESTVLKGFSIKGGIEKEGVLLALKDQQRKQAKTLVDSWLKELKILQ
ncbi:flavodoxin [Flavobacterium sp. HSC-32F16]|uniref:flavodoxin n=1 Tax=Flavobacterium sp. HSC-32F16 TaxID=2910964 RepID=UPI0020A4592D|nr:flavodoxin [Flavobacterium sp. HSC-32F16]MCP2025823.1 flavodoxin [Flavobacterium sp. HSC-32F16]